MIRQQILPKTGQLIRKVRIVEDKGDRVVVVALYGPLKGCQYELPREAIR